MKNCLNPILLATMVALSFSACKPVEKTEKSESSSENTQSSAQVSEDPLNKVQSIVERSSQGQFRATKLFDVPNTSGVRGVLVERSASPDQPKILGWTNTGGDIFIPGPLYDREGKDLTKEMLQKFGGMPAPKDIADQVQKAGFVAGKDGPIVTAFFEPYCGYCNRLFQELEPKISNGELRVRFVMVGFLAEDSLARAADIVNAADPYAALVKWENSKDKKSVKASTASDEQKNAIAQNNMLMNKAGQTGTPALLFCNKSGEVEMISGMPQNIDGFLANVGTDGHPSCSSK